MNKKFMTPIDEQVLRIAEARHRFSMTVVFNDLVNELIETDKKIDAMPEGTEKEYAKRSQQEAWDLLLSENMCDKIMLEA